MAYLGTMLEATEIELTDKGLHGYAFNAFFEKVPIMLPYFRGVYSLDDIPRNIKVREFVVVNLSKKHEPGTHWFCIVRSHFKLYEIFNSLGFSNLTIVTPYIRAGSGADLVFNHRPYQLATTATCGYFVVYFLIHRVLNYDLSFHHLLTDIFDDESNSINENKVTDFCERLSKATNDDELFE